MKTRTLSAMILGVAALSACKKDPDTVGVPATTSATSTSGSVTGAGGAGGTDSTTGAGGMTSSTTTGTGGGGGSACDLTSNCNGCAGCSYLKICKDEYDACSASADCIEYSTCEGSCADGPCLDACATKYPGGKALFDSLLTCVTCVACPVDCKVLAMGCP